jgi:hypothetical protein
LSQTARAFQIPLCRPPPPDLSPLLTPALLYGDRRRRAIRWYGSEAKAKRDAAPQLVAPQGAPWFFSRPALKNAGTGTVFDGDFLACLVVCPTVVRQRFNENERVQKRKSTRTPRRSCRRGIGNYECYIHNPRTARDPLLRACSMEAVHHF